MAKILVYRKTGNKLIDVSDKLHNALCVYKVFWPAEATLKLGSKIIRMKEFNPWPPPEQIGFDMKVSVKRPETKQDRG